MVVYSSLLGFSVGLRCVQKFIKNTGGFAFMLCSLYLFSVKLCACLVVQSDCRWNLCVVSSL